MTNFSVEKLSKNDNGKSCCVAQTVAVPHSCRIVRGMNGPPRLLGRLEGFIELEVFDEVGEGEFGGVEGGGAGV